MPWAEPWNMCRYFHAYRIDHILGFFRIWEIPGDCVTGLLGHFRPSLAIARSELDSRGIWDIDRCRSWADERHSCKGCMPAQTS